MTLQYPKGARYIVKLMPTPDFDPNAPSGEPQYQDASVLKIWNLTFGNPEQPGRIYAGTIPGGLFISDDGGDTWELSRPLWNQESRGGDLFNGDASSENKWSGTPASIDYGVFEPGVHSIVTDPRNPNRLHMAVSSGGSSAVKTADKPGKPFATACPSNTPTTLFCATASTMPTTVCVLVPPPATSMCRKIAVNPGTVSAITFHRCIRFALAKPHG